jgi:hypothetical protein
MDLVSPTIYPRSMRQFGTHLPPDQVPNAGIGPRLDYVEGRNRIALLRPTRAFAESLDLEVAGVRMQLRHAPGKTEDQLFVWLPDSRVLLAADNLYRSFPNLYAIRGTPYRDVRRWIASLDAMRALQPAHLVPSHTRPISGEAEVMRVLLAKDSTRRCRPWKKAGGRSASVKAAASDRPRTSRRRSAGEVTDAASAGLRKAPCGFLTTVLSARSTREAVIIFLFLLLAESDLNGFVSFQSLAFCSLPLAVLAVLARVVSWRQRATGPVPPGCSGEGA